MVLYTLLGQRVRTVSVPAGAALVPLSVQGLPAGGYVVRLDGQRALLTVQR